MRDLEIRGAGNILGPEQSGHIHAVGFELYTQLLNQAVEETRANQEGISVSSLERGAEESQARVSLKLSAHIPDTYISHLPTRLAVYQRLTKVRGREQIEDIREELRDRFGPMSGPLDNLLYLVDLKLLAKEAGVESITQSGATATISLSESVGGAKTPLEKALGPSGPGGQPAGPVQRPGGRRRLEGESDGGPREAYRLPGATAFSGRAWVDSRRLLAPAGAL